MTIKPLIANAWALILIIRITCHSAAGEHPRSGGSICGDTRRNAWKGVVDGHTVT